MVRFLFSVVCLCSLFCQYYDEAAPREIEQDPFSSKVFFEHEPLPEKPASEEIIARTKGVLLLGHIDLLNRDGVSGIRGLEAEGLDIPGGIDNLRSVLEPIFLDKPLSMSTINDMRRAIIQYYESYHRGLVLVVAPEQYITDDILQMVVVESRAGKVTVKGNKWFKTRTLENHLRLEEGEYIDTDVIAQDLDWINRNPFRQSDVILRPGELEGTTDVEFWVYDRLLFRPYVGFENTGFETTGRGRLLTGFNWCTPFEHLASFQYTTSTDFGRFYAYTGSYAIPLPWRHIWSWFGGYSRVRPRMPFPGIDNVGTNSQVSTRYAIPFPRTRTTLQELTFGIDYKKANNNLITSDLIVISGSKAVITQALLKYAVEQKLEGWRWSFDTHLYWSPGDLFGHQSDKDYQSLRPGAESNYVYGNYSFIPVVFLPNEYSLVFKNEMQLSNRNLLASEQFGLGGYDTVRGYDMRDINTDNGLLLSAEWRTPTVPLFTWRKNVKLHDELQFLLFWDYGLGWNNTKLPGENKSFYLMGVGPGLRYNWGTYITMRADWGIKLKKYAFTGDTSFSVFHFAVLFSY